MTELDDDLADALAMADQLPPEKGLPDPEPENLEPAPKRPRGARRAKGAPRPTPGKTPPKPGAPKTTSRRAPLAPRVAQAHVMLGLGLSFAPIPNAQAIGTTLAVQADQIGQAWEQLAKENPRVREMLEQLLTASAVGGLLMAYAPVVLAAAGKADILGALGGIVADVAPPAPAPGPLHVVTDPA